MASDVPFVNYKKQKKDSESKKAMDDLADRWAKKHAESKEKGEKISLSEFVNKGNFTKK